MPSVPWSSGSAEECRSRAHQCRPLQARLRDEGAAGSLPLPDKDAEDVSGWVCRCVQRLVGVVRAVQPQLSAEGDGPVTLPVQRRAIGNGHVQVELLRHVLARLGGAG